MQIQVIRNYRATSLNFPLNEQWEISYSFQIWKEVSLPYRIEGSQKESEGAPTLSEYFEDGMF